MAPPPWPVGFTCRALKNIKRGNFVLDQDQAAEVLKVDRTSNPPALQVRSFKTGHSGTVQVGEVQVHKTKRVGDVQVKVIHEDDSIKIPSVSSLAVHASPFLGHVQELLRNMTASNAPFPKWWGSLCGDDHKIRQMAKFISGTAAKAGTLQTLNRPDFTLKDLAKTAAHINSKTPIGTVCIYLRICTRTKDLEVRLYSGQSVDARRRFQEHETETRKTRLHGYRGQHYRFAKNSSVQMIRVLAFDRNVPDQLLCIAEQVIMLLFGTYNRQLFQQIEESPKSANELWRDGTITASQHSAYFWTDMTKRTMRNRNWPKFDYEGFNIDSPVSASYGTNKTLWWQSKVQYGGIKALNFRRSIPYKASQNSAWREMNKTLIFSLHGYEANGTTNRFDLTLINKDNDPTLPAPGTRSYVSFEIMPDGSRHPNAWARLPDVGCFTDWNLANSFAIATEYKDQNNDYRRKYWYAGGDLGFTKVASTKTNEEGLQQTYKWAIALVRYFARIRPSPDAKEWETTFGTARVRAVVFNEFTQTYTISPELPPGAEWYPSSQLPSRRKTWAAMKQELRDAGLENAGANAHPKDPEAECDLCHLTKQEHPGTGIRCLPDKEKKGCVVCRRYYGRPCTWSTNNKLIDHPANHRRRRAIFLAPMGDQPTIIPKPKDIFLDTYLNEVDGHGEDDQSEGDLDSDESSDDEEDEGGKESDGEESSDPDEYEDSDEESG